MYFNRRPHARVFQFGIFAYLVRVVEKTLGAYGLLQSSRCIIIIIVREERKKKCTEKEGTMGIGVSSYTLSTHASARVASNSCMPSGGSYAPVVSSAICSTLRRHVEAIYLVWQSIVLRPSDNNGVAANVDAQKTSPSLNTLRVFSAIQDAILTISRIACFFFSLYRCEEPPKLYRDFANVRRKSAPSWRSAKSAKVVIISLDVTSSSEYVYIFQKS